MKKVSSFVMTSALLAALVVGAGTAHADLTASGPVNPTTAGSPFPANGLPDWYQDVNGIALQGCLDNLPLGSVAPLCILPVVNEEDYIFSLPIAFNGGLTGVNPPVGPTSGVNGGNVNYPSETFYYYAANGKGTPIPNTTSSVAVLMVLEGTFLNGLATTPAKNVGNPRPRNGDQLTFQRIKVDIDSVPVGATGLYTLTHPWGTIQFLCPTAGIRCVSVTNVPVAAGPGGFNIIPDPALGQNQPGTIGPFMVPIDQVTGLLIPPVQANNHLFISNPNQTVKGIVPNCATCNTTVNANNVPLSFVSLTGPPGSGVSVTTTDFQIGGQLLGLQITPPVTGTNFGVWKTATPATPMTFTVTNFTGVPAGPLTLTPQAPFTLAADTCTGVTLTAAAPGNTCTFNAGFTPAADGLVSGTVTVTAPGDPSVTVSVSGTGDGTAPTVTIDPVIPFTKLASQSISGSVSDNVAVASVQVVVNGVSQGTATITPGTPTSTWSKTINLTNANAGNSISVTATDTAQTGGNTSAPQTATITHDTINPVVNITSPASGSLINTRTPALTFTATDANLAFSSAVVDNSPVNPTPTTLASLADGQHTVRIDAGDSAGNAASATTTFTVDATPPVIAVTSPAPINGRLGITSPALTFSVTDANNVPANTVVKLDAVVVPPGTTTLGPFTANSAHTLTVDAKDAAGNAAATTIVPFTVVLADGRVASLGATPPTIADALLVLRHIVKLITLTPDQFAHADVAPLDVNGVPNPNGVVDIADALLILRRIVGLVNTF